ncbi:helix-turn-helix domain-containing protein [Micromonospora chersina]
MTLRRQSERTLTDRQRIGHTIRAARTALGMSQRDLAAIADVRQCRVSYVETAGSDPLLSTVIDLAAGTGRRLVVAAGHHLPLLDLTADEIEALRVAALSSALDHGSEETLRSALDKLTTTEETDR